MIQWEIEKSLKMSFSSFLGSIFLNRTIAYLYLNQSSQVTNGKTTARQKKRVFLSLHACSLSARVQGGYRPCLPIVFKYARRENGPESLWM